MTARDCFGLVIRTVGLASILWGLQYLYSPIGVLLNPEPSDSSILYYLAYGVAYVLFGMYFVRGAPHLLRFAYPPEKP